jgi:murein L,D-transpeptidase YafK
MNPFSSYHLSFNLGYPNAYDRAYGRTGNYLMVHGDCVSIGCYAMTDAGIEEIYTLMQAALKGGQSFARVHVFPFPMTEANLEAYKDNVNSEFWKNLREGWDWFEDKQMPPNVNIADKHYVFSEAR